jgi:hypothetical protein
MGGQSRHRSARIATVVSGILRALPICAPIALFDVPSALAEGAQPAALRADIPAQPLAPALEAFARQTGLQLVYVSGVVRDQRSRAVSAGLGAGAQAGVVRYITNKPKLDVTEATVNAGFATTAHGAESTNLDATVNVPMITDHLAMRGVIYNERRGGYIDNPRPLHVLILTGAFTTLTTLTPVARFQPIAL